MYKLHSLIVYIYNSTALFQLFLNITVLIQENINISHISVQQTEYLVSLLFYIKDLNVILVSITRGLSVLINNTIA